jgi:uncharacterized metal-binding protein YceD (DUF177 family)
VTSEPVWSHPIKVADIPPEGEDIELVADEETRAALARFGGVLAVRRLRAPLRVVSDGSGGAVVTGHVEALVRQNCVVSLEPFDNEVHEEIAVAFAPESAQAAARKEVVEIGDDPAEAIVNGMIDLGAVAAEFFVLGIDPYPRRPGAVFTPPVAEPAEESAKPFAALAKLKQKVVNKKN